MMRAELSWMSKLIQEKGPVVANIKHKIQSSELCPPDCVLKIYFQGLGCIY